MMLTPTVRVALDRRIAEERLIALDPPFEQPDWYWKVVDDFVPIAFAMDATGALATNWTRVDELNWSNVVALRLESPAGAPLSPDDFSDHGYEG